MWNESQLQMIHWEERSRLEKQIRRKRLQREGEQMMLQRKGGSLGHSKPLGIPPVEKKHIVELFHSYPLLRPLKGAIYTLAVPPVLSIREGLIRDAQFPCLSWLSFCPLPVEILRAWRGSNQSYSLVPLKLQAHIGKACWQAPHQVNCLLGSICGSEQSIFPYTLY